MSLKKPETVREQIAAAYANLGRAHYLLEKSLHSYNDRMGNIIRQKLYAGIVSGGKPSMRSLYDDERLKIANQTVCCYCGARESITADHLIPRLKGGPDEGYNLVPACLSCNASKGSKDMLGWMYAKNAFPSLLLLRRYLKLVARYCEDSGHMDEAFPADFPELPFNLGLLPLDDFPPVPELQLQVEPAGA